MSKDLQIIAILAIRNEEAYLARCLQHLQEQHIRVAIIDNESTDGSLDIAHAFHPHVVEHIQSHPYNGYYDWQGLLLAKDRLRRRLNADWFLHQDADEILQSPVQGETLQQGIARAHERGYDAINFDEFVFVYEDNEINYLGKDYVQQMRHYYFFENHKNRLVRAFSNRITANNLGTAGHGPPLNAVRLFPQNFILRHYIALSFKQAQKKYLQRVFSQEELSKGWHANRLRMTPKNLQAPSMKRLTALPPDELPSADIPAQKQHYWDW